MFYLYVAPPVNAYPEENISENPFPSSSEMAGTAINSLGLQNVLLEHMKDSHRNAEDYCVIYLGLSHWYAKRGDTWLQEKQEKNLP